MPPTPSTSTSAPALPLREFLQLLRAPPASLTLPEAILASSKLLPASLSTRAALSTISKSSLAAAGIEGDSQLAKKLLKLRAGAKVPKEKRKSVGSDLDRPLGPPRAVVDDFDFAEIEWEPSLRGKSVLINRAPLLTAWTVVVAERLGFKREEALSFASAYVDLTAKSVLGTKAVPIGTAQSTIVLMGRRIPVLLLSSPSSSYRALSSGTILPPAPVFSSLRRAFAQQLPAVIGALKLLADSVPVADLDRVAWGLYCEFRPETGWGEKAMVGMAEILDLRWVEGKAPKKIEEEIEEEEEVKEEDENEREFEAALEASMREAEEEHARKSQGMVKAEVKAEVKDDEEADRERKRIKLSPKQE